MVGSGGKIAPRLILISGLARPPANNSMGVDWIGLVSGLGFVLSFGYWCTDFLVIQRALAAEDLKAAQRTPLIAAFPKVLFPLLTVLPGLIALPLLPNLGKDLGANSYNQAMPVLLSLLYPSGMLGVGLTAMLASFMSGMAGNVTASIPCGLMTLSRAI